MPEFNAIKIRKSSGGGVKNGQSTFHEKSVLATERVKTELHKLLIQIEEIMDNQERNSPNLSQGAKK